MLTIFTCPKPFEGHIGLIQRNAIRRWLRLHPDGEVVLVAAETDTRDVARELGVRCSADVVRNDFGTPLLPSVFAEAERIARHDHLAYVNADIMLSQEFVAAFRTCARHAPFMMVGERIDCEVTEPVHLADAATADRWFGDMRARGKPAGEEAIDYFVFRKGFFRDMPAFALGRTAWDNWILYFARRSGARLVDASAVVTAIHQNHDYRHAREGTKTGVWRGEEAQHNRRLCGGHYFYLYDCNYRLSGRGMAPTRSDEHIRRRMQRLKEYRPRRWRALLTWGLRYQYCRFVHRGL